MSSDKNHQEILDSAEFKKLISKRWAVSIALASVMLSIYFGYLLLIAFNKPVLASMIGHNLTLAIPVGLGIIISAWLLTGVYVLWANDKYDGAVNEIKAKIRKN